MPGDTGVIQISRFQKERRKSLRRYFKKLRLRRSRKKRAAFSLLLFAAVLYLAAVGAYKDAFLSVEELEDTHTILEYGAEKDSGLFDVFRISVRIKSGEIIFFYQRTETDEPEDGIHNVRP